MGLENKFAYNFYNYHSNFFRNFDMTIKVTKANEIKLKQFNADCFINILYFYIIEYLNKPKYKIFEYAIKLMTDRKLIVNNNFDEYEFKIYAWNKKVTSIQTFEDYKTMINEIIIFLDVLEENEQQQTKYEREHCISKRSVLNRYGY